MIKQEVLLSPPDTTQPFIMKKGNVLFNDVLDTLIFFTVIWRRTYGKRSIR